MTWEETIKFIRTKEEFKDLVKLAYLDEDLIQNVELYKAGDEYKEICKIIKTHVSNEGKILDIGCGNGISSVSFAIDGFQVTAVEPDSSETIGAGAISKLKEHYHLGNLEVFEGFAENLKFNSNSFDIVFSRQAMHHANNLEKFVSEMARVLKPGGLFLTVRDHVVYNSDDKEWFLESHPLQKFYHGENAFSSSEYKTAINYAGLKLLKELMHFDSVINYFPGCTYKIELKKHLKSKIGFLAQIPFVFKLYDNRLKQKFGQTHFEKKIPGRMYSYIATKK